MPRPTPTTTTGRFFAVLAGCTIGTAIGFYSLSDYQIIKKLPPAPLEFNEDGTPKKVPFRISFRETRPLELKPEVLEKRKIAAEEYLKQNPQENEQKQDFEVDKQNAREAAE